MKNPNNNLNELKGKAEKRKNNKNFRHTLNNSDIKIANDNAKLMGKEQYRTFSDKG
ncbi:MAG: hypothetical protein FWF15_08315 [Oscillospiraceae bacterium]|nr:hypothetical protein [Oscillospiraceae bacterium]